MLSEAVQLELAKHADAIIMAIAFGLVSLIGGVANAILTIRNGRKTEALHSQINGTLRELEAARLVESNRLKDEAVLRATVEERQRHTPAIG